MVGIKRLYLGGRNANARLDIYYPFGCVVLCNYSWYSNDLCDVVVLMKVHDFLVIAHIIHLSRYQRDPAQFIAERLVKLAPEDKRDAIMRATQIGEIEETQ